MKIYETDTVDGQSPQQGTSPDGNAAMEFDRCLSKYGTIGGVMAISIPLEHLSIEEKIWARPSRTGSPKKFLTFPTITS